jgi:hypothetical protein
MTNGSNRPPVAVGLASFRRVRDLLSAGPRPPHHVARAGQSRSRPSVEDAKAKSRASSRRTQANFLSRRPGRPQGRSEVRASSSRPDGHCVRSTTAPSALSVGAISPTSDRTVVGRGLRGRSPRASFADLPGTESVRPATRRTTKHRGPLPRWIGPGSAAPPPGPAPLQSAGPDTRVVERRNSRGLLLRSLRVEQGAAC